MAAQASVHELATGRGGAAESAVTTGAGVGAGTGVGAVSTTGMGFGAASTSGTDASTTGGVGGGVGHPAIPKLPTANSITKNGSRDFIKPPLSELKRRLHTFPKLLSAMPHLQGIDHYRTSSYPSCLS